MEPDEPIFDPQVDDSTPQSDPAVRVMIERLLRRQRYAVLCVQGGGQPYGALVAFAVSDDFKNAVFATPVTTRKYRLLSQCAHVALVIDNRSEQSDDLMQVEAVTATGIANEVERGEPFDRWSELLISRHPYLKSFVPASTCALFRIDVVRFLHVVRFQEVRQWIPTSRS